jgi:hypothetical protein
MALPLKESKAAADIAELLYDFLPGSGSRKWTNHTTFKTVADKVGVGGFWQGGSKLPAVKGLIDRTLEFKRDRFEPLILEIVRAGITYRQKNGNAIKPDEIDRLNGLIREVGFKFPDLWDPQFRASLAVGAGNRAKQHVEEALAEERRKLATQSEHSAQLAAIKEDFFALFGTATPQQAGFAFEKILNRLFALFGLTPREPFRVVGEQIDGSFDLDHEIYLVEAKWSSTRIPQADLLTFHGKVTGKSRYSRGVFIALNGVTDEAQDSITRGKEAVFFVVNGHDLTMVLSEQIDLAAFLRQRQRLLAEEGLVVVPFGELWSGSRAH